jgi:hypothetical protein
VICDKCQDPLKSIHLLEGQVIVCPASRFAFDSFLSIDSYSKTLSLFVVSVPKGNDLEEEIAALM